MIPVRTPLTFPEIILLVLEALILAVLVAVWGVGRGKGEDDE